MPERRERFEFHGRESRLPEELQPYLGVVTRHAPPELTAQIRQPEGFGLIVEDILPESPAATAGLQRNDLLLRFEDQLLAHPMQLEALIRRTGKDKEATLTILRGGTEQQVKVKVGEKMLPERRPPPPFGREERGPRYGSAASEDSTTANPGERRTVYSHDHARVVRKDGEGHFELMRKDGQRRFIVKDLEGKTKWEGPIESPQEREAMPPEFREKLRLLEVAQPPPGHGAPPTTRPLPVQ
jgi:hypothetical protein